MRTLYEKARTLLDNDAAGETWAASIEEAGRHSKKYPNDVAPGSTFTAGKNVISSNNRILDHAVVKVGEGSVVLGCVFRNVNCEIGPNTVLIGCGIGTTYPIEKPKDNWDVIIGPNNKWRAVDTKCGVVTGAGCVLRSVTVTETLNSAGLAPGYGRLELGDECRLLSNRIARIINKVKFGANSVLVGVETCGDMRFGKRAFLAPYEWILQRIGTNSSTSPANRICIGANGGIDGGDDVDLMTCCRCARHMKLADGSVIIGTHVNTSGFSNPNVTALHELETKPHSTVYLISDNVPMLLAGKVTVGEWSLLAFTSVNLPEIVRRSLTRVTIPSFSSESL